jgi:flagellar biosynthesis chaperone FliJ
MRSGKLLLLTPIAALALGPALVRAEEETSAQKIERLDRQVWQLRTEVDELRGNLTNTSLTTNRTVVELQDLDRRYQALKKLVDAHDDALKRSISRSYSVPPPSDLGVEGETSAQRVERLDRQFRQMSADLREFRRQLTDPGLTTNRAAADLQDLERRLEALRRVVDAQERSISRSYSFAPVPARTGTILLENRSPIPVTFTVNGTSYFVAPYQSQPLPNQPAGVFTYQVATDEHGVIRPTVTRTLTPGEVYRIFTDPALLPLALIP